MFLCPRCRLFKAETFLKVLNHLRVHESEPGFSIQCGHAGCPRTYQAVESLKRHFYRVHRDAYGRAEQVPAVQETAAGSASEEEAMWQDVDSGHGDEANDVVADEMTDEDFQRATALFIMKIRDERKLPQVRTFLHHTIIL